MKRIVTLSILVVACSGALAKLPAPVLSDADKAKAAEAAAKAAHANKVAEFQLCRSMDRVAAAYAADARKAGKEVKPTETPPCVDPGAFSAPAAAPAAAPVAAPAAATQPAATKAPGTKG
jgi:hypothetical protein